MKRLLVVVMVLAAADASASTLVLKGGKRLDVVGFQRQGNYFVVKLVGGRAESYPVSAVDLDATKAANEAPGAAAPQTVAPAGPHSPFFGAQSRPGKPAITVTDSDVQHVQPPDETPGEKGQAPKAASTEGQVVLVDYSKQKAEDGTWEVTATIVNAGAAPVTGVAADVRLLDGKGATLGTGTAALAGTLAPTQQASVTTRIASPVEPVQIGFAFRWQSITPQPTPAPGAATGAAPAATPAAKNPAAPVRTPPQQAGYTVPAGSSPNTMPSDPMAMPSLTTPPTSLQVTRPQPPADKPKG